MQQFFGRASLHVALVLFFAHGVCLGEGVKSARADAHWAFSPPVRPAIPAGSDSTWARNPVDHFVSDRLRREGMTPSPEADRVTLLRRLSLDLAGLPPTIDEIDRVLNDPSPDWYASLVERLLASPHYGERWARHWLDGAQYADSDGFEKDKPRQVFMWRDWVVNALNADMPYDRFVIEQIAGDLLPNATQYQRIATGFLRNSMINEEGGIDPEQFRMEALFNRMDLIGRSVLGLTVGCAQCHTHKYDPLTQTEYYRMLAFLNNTHEATSTVYTTEELRQVDTLRGKIADLEEEIKSTNPHWRDRMADWAADVRHRPAPEWKPVELAFDDTTAGGQKFREMEDGSYLAEGYAPTRFGPKMTGATELNEITAVRLELLTDPNLPRTGPGRSIYGSSALSEFELYAAPDGTPVEDLNEWTRIPIASALADVNPAERLLGPEFPERNKKEERTTGPIAFAIDGDNKTAWTTDCGPGRRNQPREAIFVLEKSVTLEPGMRLLFRLSQMHGGWNSDDNQNNNIGRFRISVTGSTALPDDVIPPLVRAAIASGDEDAIFGYWRTTVAEWAEANAEIDELGAQFPSGYTQLALAERDTPRVTRRLERGDFLQPAEHVEPGTPAFLHSLRTEGEPDRLDFARWLVARESPTAARAFVNRVWQHYFGTGLVQTTSDLGLQGERPSHPHLLDWLAVEFMENGWGVKDLHRLIVTSATYRQSSRVTREQLERDLYNRLLARASRFRVEGEIVRDVALAASGLLNPEMGGPGVYPPAPDYLFVPPASYGPKTWDTDQGPNRYRRALYTFRFRSVPYPVLQTFDTPAGDAPCTRRESSNTPLQALTTLNEPLFMECAAALAKATLDKGGDSDTERIAYAFRRCVTRAPSESESDTLHRFLERQRERIADGELRAAEIVPEIVTESAGAELAAWTLTARVILNLDETIMRQ